MRGFWQGYKAWGSTRTAKVLFYAALVFTVAWNVWRH